MLSKIKSAAKRIKKELKVYKLVLKHKQTPKAAKFLLAIAVGYALLPFDLIPDFIPIIGQLDDVIIVLALITLALKIIPGYIIEECRSEAGFDKQT